LLPSSDGCVVRPFRDRDAHDKLLRQIVTKASTINGVGRRWVSRVV